MKDIEPNCVGYAYEQMGIIPREEYIEPPTLNRLLRRFRKVDNIQDAQLIAIVRQTVRGLVISHLAILEPDKETVRHRKGMGAPIRTGKTDEELDSYYSDEAEIVYLALKPKPRLFGRR